MTYLLNQFLTNSPEKTAKTVVISLPFFKKKVHFSEMVKGCERLHGNLFCFAEQ